MEQPQALESGPQGAISNINLDHKPDINHFNIEKIDRLHATVIARIQSVMRSGSFWPGWEVHTTK